MQNSQTMLYVSAGMAVLGIVIIVIAVILAIRKK